MVSDPASEFTPMSPMEKTTAERTWAKVSGARPGVPWLVTVYA